MRLKMQIAKECTASNGEGGKCIRKKDSGISTKTLQLWLHKNIWIGGSRRYHAGGGEVECGSARSPHQTSIRRSEPNGRCFDLVFLLNQMPPCTTLYSPTQYFCSTKCYLVPPCISTHQILSSIGPSITNIALNFGSNQLRKVVKISYL